MNSITTAIEVAAKVDRLLNQSRGGEALDIYLQTMFKSGVPLKNLIILAQIANARGRYDEALFIAENVLAKRPRDVAGLSVAAEAAFRAGRNALALKYSKLGMQVCKKAPDLIAIGGLLNSLNKAPMALEAFEKALVIDPKIGELHSNLANTLVSLGKFEEAEKHFDKSIELGAENYSNYLNRSRLKKQSSTSNHISELEKLIADKRPTVEEQVYLNYTLAKEYEDLEMFDESFAALERASSVLSERIQYKIDDDKAAHETMLKFHDAEFVNAPGDGHESNAPIFIVGMPRSGTTLVESILCRHSEVSSAGEPQVFGRVIERLITFKEPSLAAGPQSNLVRLSKQIDFDRAGRAYLEMTAPLASGTVRFTDKLPGNYLYSGLITRALPGAKIVHVRRNPLDGCFSIFKQLFMGRYQFSYNQETLAQYYAAYLRVMDHFEDILGDRIYTIHYEDLVVNHEQETRKLVEACGLGWEDNCLRSNEESNAVMTASAFQVRQPIYESSVRLWKKYDTHLRPLQEALKEEGVEF